jgi:Flp pilus assembly protein TadG
MNLTSAKSLLARFRRCRTGGIAMMMAISAPAVMATAAVATDYLMMTSIHSGLQAAADAAALGSAKEITIAGASEQQIKAVATALALQNIEVYASRGSKTTGSAETAGANDSPTSAGVSLPEGVTVSVNVLSNEKAVEVTVEQKWNPFFLQLLSTDVTPVRVKARAQYLNSTLICVLGLSPGDSASLHFRQNSRVTADGCMVYANSTSSTALKIEDNATVNATSICVVGGYAARTAQMVAPAPTTDCPPAEDPLASRQPPSVGGCDHHNLKLTSKNQTLNPGTYCGGLRIDGTSNVTLNPGIYVIKDGIFVVSGTATVVGEYTGFYFTGSAANLNFDSLTTIDLIAPRDGPMAGLLFFGDRVNSSVNIHKITSDNARRLLGTVYLPQGTLRVDSNSPVADESAYTAIVVKNLQLNEGPNLILRSNYDQTDVPVPDGLFTKRLVLAK